MKPYYKGIINSKIEILVSLITILKYTTREWFDYYQIGGLCWLRIYLESDKIFSKKQSANIKLYFIKYLPLPTTYFSWPKGECKPRRRWLRKRITIELFKIIGLLIYYNFWAIIASFIVLSIFVFGIILLSYINPLWMILFIPVLFTMLIFSSVLIRSNIRL